MAIIGAGGGLGHYAVQIAKAFGYKVLGVDVGREKLDFIKSLGADYALDAAEAAQFVKEKFGGVYASIVFSSKLAGFELGLKLMKRGGVFISVGMPAASEGAISLSPLDLLARDPLIMSSAVGNVEEMRELVQLAAEGKVKTHISREACLTNYLRYSRNWKKGPIPARALINNMTQ